MLTEAHCSCCLQTQNRRKDITLRTHIEVKPGSKNYNVVRHLDNWTALGSGNACTGTRGWQGVRGLLQLKPK